MARKRSAPLVVRADTAALADHAEWLGAQARGLTDQLKAALLAGRDTAGVRADLNAALAEWREATDALARHKASAEAVLAATREAQVSARTAKLAGEMARRLADRLEAVRPPPAPVLHHRVGG
jgi:hypothetical protein